MSTSIGQASPDTTFYVDVPDLFHPLPLTNEEAELDDQLDAMADELMLDADDNARRAWLDFNKAIMGTLLQEETRYVALCCEGDGDSISPAALIVAVPQLSFGDPQMAAAGIVQVLGSGMGADDARILNLPCGPAAVVVREHRLRLPDPAELGIQRTDVGDRDQAGIEGEQELPVREAQMFIPYQPWQRMITVTLSTPAIDDWDAYARIFIRIGRSVRFDQ